MEQQQYMGKTDNKVTETLTSPKIWQTILNVDII